ncbi:MAG TPA: DUF58 domain-containing protein [Gemmatimonadaceae bacterium]|nr:DUF58 domain-containing protein [Gemmatimonadaceae bacterium]
MLRALVGRLRTRDPLWGVYPSQRLAALVLALAVLWFIPGRAGAIVATVGVLATVVAIAFDYIRLPHRADLSVDRVAPETVGLGDAETFEYTIGSTWPWPIVVRVTDEIPLSIDVGVPPAPFDIAARGELQLALPARADERGRFVLGAIALRVSTPLGLLQRILRFHPGDSVVVVPSLTNVRRFRLLAVQNRLSEAGIRALRQRGEGSSFAGLRDYSPGDDPRMVDWKATARHARLITREQTIERSQTVMSLIDCGRAMTQLAGRYPRFEHVLSAALVLSDVAATSGDRVGMIAFDDTIRSFAAPQRGTAALRSLRTALSALDATMTEPDYASAFRMLALRQPRRALVVLFTDVIDVRTAQSFVAHAGRAARRHMILVVALQNQALLAASRPSTAGSLALFRSAAAEELIREREEALLRMRRAGISVLDIAPGQMAAGVVNRYLDIKARGLL